MNVEEEKENFLRQIKCWTKTQHKRMAEKKAWAVRHAINSAVGRKNPLFYKNSDCWGDEAFRNDWEAELIKAEDAYRNPVHDKIEKIHIDNIESIAQRLSETHGCRVLHEGKMRIGNSQKALNLYLKFLWCLKEIPYTPHCPLDKEVLVEELKLRGARWTACKDMPTYQRWIGECVNSANKHPCVKRALKLKNGKIKREEILSYWELIVWRKHCCKKRKSPASSCK